MLASDYRLDIYNPNGTFLAQVPGLAAARLQVDLWRNLFTLNYEILAGSGRTEPSVAEWIPSTPGTSARDQGAADTMTDINRWHLVCQNRVADIWYNQDYTVYGLDPRRPAVRAAGDNNIVYGIRLGGNGIALRCHANVNCTRSCLRVDA